MIQTRYRQFLAKREVARMKLEMVTVVIQKNVRMWLAIR